MEPNDTNRRPDWSFFEDTDRYRNINVSIGRTDISSISMVRAGEDVV